MDNALADLKKITNPPLDDDFAGYWAPLLRAAIRIRLFDVHQGKDTTVKEYAQIIQDIETAIGKRRGAEAYAAMANFLEKGGNREYVAKIREAAKRDRVEYSAADTFDVDIEAAFHKCLAQTLARNREQAVVRSAFGRHVPT